MLALPTRQLASQQSVHRVRQGLDVVAEIKAQGLPVDGVQLELRQELDFDHLTDSGVRQLKQMIGERQLKVGSGILATRYALAEPEKIDQRVDAIKRGLEILGKLHASQLICRLGRVPVETASRPYEKLFEIVSDLAVWGNRHGTGLCLSVSFSDLDVTLAFIESIKTGLVTLDFDPLAVLKSGRKLDETLQKALPCLGHATLQDAIREREEDFRAAPIGEGELDWLTLMATLASAPLPLWQTLQATNVEHPLPELVQSLSRLKPFLSLI